MSKDDAEQLVKVIKTLLGTEGVTLRIAVGPKDIMVSLGGGTAELKKVIAAAKAAGAPLAKAPSIAKVADRLPKTRVGVIYLSVENALNAGSKVATALGQKPLPFEPGKTSAPVAGMLVADPVGLHVGLYVPTELMVSIRGMVNQSMRQGGPAAPTTRPVEGTEPQSEPQPEF